MNLAESIELPFGAEVRITIDGRVSERDGKPCILTPDGALYFIPASAQVDVLRRRREVPATSP